MSFVHGTRKIAILPQMARDPLTDVLPTGEVSVRPTERLGQGILALGHQDQVYVIAHQAVAEYVDPVPPAVIAQGVEIDLAVQVAEEYRLPLVAPLGNVVRQARNNHSGKTAHDKEWA